MRKEIFIVGDYVHVYNRGNRKELIVRDEKDKSRFIQGLRFFNDSHSSTNILRQINLSKPGFDRLTGLGREPKTVFEMGWPLNWPEKDPLVKILCYCLSPNHFHLLLKEIKENGISRFMQKLGVGFTNYFNAKYKEVGRVFQGPYKAKIVKEQIYLEYLSVYIQVINVLELFPGGLKEAFKNINKALQFAEKYLFSSYQDYINSRESLITDKDIFGKIFSEPNNYKKFVRNIIIGRKYEILDDLKID